MRLRAIALAAFLLAWPCVAADDDPLGDEPARANAAKLAVVAGMALIVAERTEGSWRNRNVGHLDVVLMLGVAAVPAVLILAQPDLGTMLVLLATAAAFDAGEYARASMSL